MKSSTHRGERLRGLFIALAVIMLAGCATVPENYPRTASYAEPVSTQTTLGQLLEPHAARAPGLSGFDLLERGEHALQARLALAALAERSIDAQYFIWSTDRVGKLLGATLLAAAERGVRVRVLVDDFYLGGRDERIALFSSHPNIQIRVFNPVATRRTELSRLVGFVANFRELNHRMHNKLFLVDGAFGVAGGRNVADEYYGIDPEFNMRDRDVLAAGPVVEQLSTSFDTFWNSSWSVPFEAVTAQPPDPEKARAVIADMLSLAARGGDVPYGLPRGLEALTETAAEVAQRLTWAPAEVYYDVPDAPQNSEDGGKWGRVRRALTRFVDTAKREVLIQSPYLIPQAKAIAAIESGTERGVSVRILTNSLASTDMVPAQAAYARHRASLLGAGAKVYELRPDAATRATFIAPSALKQGAQLGLHAKTIVADREALYVGTYNLDRRSAVLNTEIALIIRSRTLASRVAAAIDVDMQSDNSWEVVLGENDESVWLEPGPSGTVRHLEPPQADSGRRLGAAFMSLLPIEDQL